MNPVVSIVLRALLIGVLVCGIIGEETASGKGSPITFQAEVSKMLDILINSLYTNRAIFLRELISNGSDALDKVRLLYLTEPREPLNKDGQAPTLDIRIRVNDADNELILQDGGVGMSKEDMVANLGSLGSSGTKRFMEKMKESNDANLIGQFGVGFYSAFLVAERVRVASKSDESDTQWVWESTGDGQYFIYEDPRGNTLGRGTEITLVMKSDAVEFLSEDKIRNTIHRYSEFVNFPIYLEAEDASEKDKKGEKDDTDAEPPKKKWELVNENKPIWTRKPEDVTDEEYNKFYKALTKAYTDPMFYSHFSVDGEVRFDSILFIPDHAPGTGMQKEMFVQDNIRLYVRRVFITDEFRDLLPRYLNFVKGVVDSDDLPLNVSREVLQENRILRVIKKKLVRKALQMLKDIADSDAKILERQKEREENGSEDDADKENDEPVEIRPGSKRLSKPLFDDFWEEFGNYIRLGVLEDPNNRGRLVELLRYKSSKSEKVYASFAEYEERMKEGQKGIYYVTGDSLNKVKQSPVAEDAIKRDIEVLYMVDPIDEYVMQQVTDYHGKKLINLAKEGPQFEDETKQQRQIDALRKEKYEPLLKWLKDLLRASVTKAVLTKRLTSEAFILSSLENDMTARMANLVRGQALTMESYAKASRVLEVNYRHPLVDEIFKRITVDEDDTVAKDIATVLFDTANLQNDFPVDDLSAFARRLNRLLRSSVDLPSDESLLPADDDQYVLPEGGADDEEEDEDNTQNEEEETADTEDEEDL